MYSKGLPQRAALTAIALAITYALVFFWVPQDTDQGFVQKIFYLHVPLGITSLVGFVVAGFYAVRHLRRGNRADDARSYVAIHIAIIFGAAVLVTGSIWARASWGKWWVWEEPTLVSFLIVFLLYSTYYPFRYAIEDPERQARYSSIFAIIGAVFVPLNFMAVRMTDSLVHPRVFATAEGGLPDSMLLVFCVAIASVALLYITLFKLELTLKQTKGRVAKAERRLNPEGPRDGGASAIAPRMN